MPPLEIPHFLWSTIQTACNLENLQNPPRNWSIYPGESPKSPSQLVHLPWRIPKTPLTIGPFTLENPQNPPHNWSIYPGESPKSPSQLVHLPWRIPKIPLGIGPFILENPPK
ncbi:hypothetical protein PISMIDRAFT_17747 [Pisolithus microcarpus 441]|uniref:Uncharacterized protein n=1 Tax=Pisolithus microcarpus 441 TaxID=765257 RepID=A0A0C9Z1E8_9AGAM|nr:hypothetical protein PISMIDRAFT_17747 [Pisolithus microcarpus 441]